MMPNMPDENARVMWVAGETTYRKHRARRAQGAASEPSDWTDRSDRAPPVRAYRF